MATASTTNLWGDEKKADSGKPKLRIGLIGCGGISGVHLDGWKRIADQAEIVAVADPIESRRNERGDQTNVATTMRFPYFEHMLKAGVKLDAIDICTPNGFHAPISIAALNAGLHVLCEKPLAKNPGEVREMIAARDRAKNKILMTAQHMRFLNTSSHLKAYLDKHPLGEVYYCRAQFNRRRFLPGRPGFIDKS